MSDPRAALVAIGALPDAEIDIGDAALQLARVDAPGADWRAARAHLSLLARQAVQAAVGIDAADIGAQAAALAKLLGRRHGYAGDAETYDDLANANLIRVIERRRGLPVALGIVWLHAARAAGWAAFGIDHPGHFLIGIAAAGTAVVVDPFGGGGHLPAEPGLPEMPARAVLLRLQNNIRLRRLAAGDIGGALACAEDMLRIAPDAAAAHAAMAELRSRFN